jgi:hypothetical protein
LIAVTVFKRALLDHLLADSAIVGLVSTRVFDETPQDIRDGAINAESPYIFLGPVAVSRFENDCAPGWQVDFRLYAAGYEFGREQVWNVIGAIGTAIDGIFIDLPEGFAHSPCIRILRGGDIIDPLTPKLCFVDATTIVFGPG